VLLENDGQGGPPRRGREAFDGEQRPDFVVSSLGELQALLQRDFQLLPPAPVAGERRAGA
jgi:hypothetical protein